VLEPFIDFYSLSLEGVNSEAIVAPLPTRGFARLVPLVDAGFAGFPRSCPEPLDGPWSAPGAGMDSTKVNRITP
jgi:hypothetical protein